ncbi:hypothetical protein DICVIV_09920 [Dictyocaulus viviparus]|uniref:Uncharacterized protein n=1 Tax=Dictyocaulus viviparus TaxID=29172 RepID=A0A0D8XJP2_DICVI|nr:hypothetical protein DICVIV_09920 [Dictyocaulus viviparus]
MTDLEGVGIFLQFHEEEPPLRSHKVASVLRPFLLSLHTPILYMGRMRTSDRVVETRIDLLEWGESPTPKEDCATCRALDCDIIFALLFTLVIACLLVLIMVFWLKGVLQYEE